MIIDSDGDFSYRSFENHERYNCIIYAYSECIYLSDMYVRTSLISSQE